jgi:hypothetical protein
MLNLFLEHPELFPKKFDGLQFVGEFYGNLSTASSRLR